MAIASVLVARMESFEGVVEFVAVAEIQGFTAAAKKLGCSTSHVSRQIARLEERLGCALVARTTRLIGLTDAGTQYYQQCKVLVDGLQQANEQLNSHQYHLNGTLRVSTAGYFGESHVVPALIEFSKVHPELSLDINFDTRNTNFVDDGFDFVVRYGKLTDSDLIARRLVSHSMVLVASPDYLEQFGTPSQPSDLKSHRCVIANSDNWRFIKAGESISVKVTGTFRANNSNAVINACVKGLGLAYLPVTNVKSLIAQGVLVPVLKPYWDKGVGSWIVYQNRQFLPTRARVAIDYLVNYFSDWEG